MYCLVDARDSVNAGYAASSTARASRPSGSRRRSSRLLQTASRGDLDAVQGFLLGDFEGPGALRRDHPQALPRADHRARDQRSLEQTLVLFDAGIDDVLPKPVHVREIWPLGGRSGAG